MLSIGAVGRSLDSFFVAFESKTNLLMREVADLEGKIAEAKMTKADRKSVDYELENVNRYASELIALVQEDRKEKK